MRLQFASDLHLNSWSENKVPFEKILRPVADALVLCGDIGHPDSVMLHLFLKWCSKRWKTIFWIAGFHELTNAWNSQFRQSINTYDECLIRMKNLANTFPNINVLDKEAFVTEDGFILLGCSLWTRMSDTLDTNPISKDITAHYKEDLQWLTKYIKTAKQPIIVVSYCPPTYSLMDENLVNKRTSVHYSVESEILIRSPVLAWVSGYLHKSATIVREWFDSEGNAGSTLMVVNPRGYPGENTGYRDDAVLRV